MIFFIPCLKKLCFEYFPFLISGGAGFFSQPDPGGEQRVLHVGEPEPIPWLGQ